ncbi:MAG TPA: sigma-70 family RNA polymerase sigma factor [Acidimicrobiales bacterium]|nr:sigma-70 family RNA polymerase sigma factor [Acidimicrobiales bacterium]
MDIAVVGVFVVGGYWHARQRDLIRRDAKVWPPAAAMHSLDAVEEPAGEGSLAELAEEDAALEQTFARQEVARLLGRLHGEERTVVILRFFHDLTQREIGERIGRSQMHVSRVLTRALQTMREATPEPLTA